MYHCEQFSIKLPALWTSLNVPSEVLSTIFFECFIDFLSDRAKGCFFCWSFYLFVFLVQTVMTVHCTLMVTCGDLLTLLYVVTCCVLLYIVLFSCIVLWSPAGKGLTSGLSCIWYFLVILSLSNLISWVRCSP